MKSEEQIRSRLDSLYQKHQKIWVKENTRPSPDNCIYNHTHFPNPLIPRPPDLEFKLAPRKQHTLVVIDNNDKPIRICMHGSENNETWNGDICDTVSHASSCPKFASNFSEKESQDQFHALMLDDEYVYENHRDIAILQWILGVRHNENTKKEGLFYRIFLFLTLLFSGRKMLSGGNGVVDDRNSSGE